MLSFNHPSILSNTVTTMALLSHPSLTGKTQADGSVSLHPSAHATLHTLGIIPSVGATGTLAVKVRPIGGALEPLYQGTTPVVINLAAIVSPVFIAGISEVTLTPTSVVGSYDATLSSHGDLPQD